MCLGGRSFEGRDLFRDSSQAPGLCWQREGDITALIWFKWQHGVLIYPIPVFAGQILWQSCWNDWGSVCVGWLGCFSMKDDSRRAVINRVQSACSDRTDTLIGQSMNFWRDQSASMSASMQQYCPGYIVFWPHQWWSHELISFSLIEIEIEISLCCSLKPLKGLNGPDSSLSMKCCKY